MLTVLKYSIPVALKLLEISAVVTIAATGWPFPIGLPEHQSEVSQKNTKLSHKNNANIFYHNLLAQHISCTE